MLGANHAQGENMFSMVMSQEEKDRKEQKRTEATEHAKGTYATKSQREAIYIFLGEETESSMLAHIVQTTIRRLYHHGLCRIQLCYGITKFSTSRYVLLNVNLVYLEVLNLV
jgi:hypothetical protein